MPDVWNSCSRWSPSSTVTMPLEIHSLPGSHATVHLCACPQQAGAHGVCIRACLAPMAPGLVLHAKSGETAQLVAPHDAESHPALTFGQDRVGFSNLPERCLGTLPLGRRAQIRVTLQTLLPKCLFDLHEMRYCAYYVECRTLRLNLITKTTIYIRHTSSGDALAETPRTPRGLYITLRQQTDLQGSALRANKVCKRGQCTSLHFWSKMRRSWTIRDYNA